MKGLLEQRSRGLVSEQQKGREALAELDDRRAQLVETLLRIEGAIAVLREMLADGAGEPDAEPSGEAAQREPLRQVSP